MSHLFFVQVQLSSDKLGQSVDDCDALLKKHEAFERLISTQEEKVNTDENWEGIIHT